ncbi:MAG: hypothetical protein WC744_04115 [Patescibacteria group bacterium]|jgi:4-amino-4-deoxy-L-arabinose transferase-like glycosyltransferase
MKKIIPIIILTIASALLIFYRFSDIPKYLAFDEVEFTKLALSLNNKPCIPYSQMATGHSTLYFYILLASLKTFGINTFALRFPAAIFGILSVTIFYLIIKKAFEQLNNLPSGRQGETMKQFLPFFLTLILLSSRWFLNFSRFSFEVTFLLFLELTSIFFLIKTVFQKERLSLIFSGIFAGLAFLSYTPGRIFFLLPLSFLVFQLFNSLTRKQFSNMAIKQLLYFLVPFIIMIIPLTSYLLTNKDNRVDQQFFLKNNEMTINEKASGLWSNISSTALMFFIKGDMNGRHNYPGKPALNPILGILFIIGLVISIKNWKNPYNFFSIFYFLLSIFPALMTYPWENPNMLRTYTVLPSVIYFIGNAIVVLDETALKILKNKMKLPKYFILNTLYFLLIFSSFYELRTYFKYQSLVFKESFEIRLPLDKAIKLPYEKKP